MGYIYKIYSIDEPNTAYIGQSSGQVTHELSIKVNDSQISASGSRPLQHFSGVYDDGNLSHENILFHEWLKTHQLSSMRIEIYDESNLYGLPAGALENFFSVWSIGGNQPTTVNLSGDVLKSMNVMTKAAYLDAAEILHTYAWQTAGKKNLAVQMGGQKYSFVAKLPNNQGSLILNNTMSPAQVVDVLNQDPNVIGQIQKYFSKNFNKFLNEHIFHVPGKYFPDGQKRAGRLADMVAQYSVVNFIPKVNNSTPVDKAFQDTNARLWSSGFYAYILQQIVVIMQRELEKQFPPNLGVIFHSLKNAWSNDVFKFAANFEGKGNYGFLNILSNIFKSKAMINAIWDTKYLNDQKAIKNVLYESLAEKLTFTFNDRVSIYNFFQLEFINTQTRKTIQHDYKMNVHIQHGDQSYNQLFHNSLKRMSYFYCYKYVRQLIQGSNTYHIKYSVVDNGVYYHVISTTRLGQALFNMLHNKSTPFQQTDFLWNYIHQCLTIMINNDSFNNNQIRKPMNMQYINKYPLGILSIQQPNSAGQEGYLAYQFSESTFKDITEWQGAKINEMKFY